jgi:mannitol-1-phosphate/altronate dehydrogenase
MRKLEGKDRLVGSAKLAEEAGISPEKLMFAAAAALFYCSQSDSSCSTEQEDIEDSDLIKIFYRVSGLDPAKPISRLALKTLSSLFSSRCTEGECAEGPLLSLDNFFWA